jgi:hypothetical protein
MHRAVLLLILLSACSGMPAANGGATDELRLTVSPDPASAGQMVTLTLHNGTAEEIGYNLCTSGLQREVDGSWQQVPEDRICTMELRLLPPGEEAIFPLELPATPAGTYRYVNRLERGAAMQDVHGEPFRIR